MHQKDEPHSEYLPKRFLLGIPNGDIVNYFILICFNRRALLHPFPLHQSS